MVIAGLFFVYFNYFLTLLQIKTVNFCETGIRTRIVKKASTLTTRPLPPRYHYIGVRAEKVHHILNAKQTVTYILERSIYLLLLQLTLRRRTKPTSS